MTLLFTLAHWHALAKLRQHTDPSLDILESTTIRLAELLRDFQGKTCSNFDTQELKRESAARERRTAKKSAANKSLSERVTVPIEASAIAGSGPPIPVGESGPLISVVGNAPPSVPITGKTAPEPPAAKVGRRFKVLNLNTYKDHSLGDYVDTIRRNGTTDSYSTEPVRRCIL